MEEIISIDLTPLHVPFKKALRETMVSDIGLGMAIPAEEQWLGGDFVICQCKTNEGHIGIGEAFVWLPESGVSPNQIIDAIEHGLIGYMLGESPFNVEKMRFRMDNNVAHSEVAKGLLDMTCYDLMGKIAGRPACDFMGGKSVNEIPLAALIPLAEPILMKGFTRSYYKKGFRTFRYKLGNCIEEDVSLCKMFRDTFGNKVRLRVDYNQAYSPPEAVRAIKAIEPHGIDYAEQPVKKDDYLAMVYVQKRVDTPLLSHEGFFSLQDFITLVELGAVGVLGINSERPGGVTQALKAVNYAELHGLGTVLHNQPLGIASAMHIHFAAAKHNSLGHATELFGQEMMEDDLIMDPIDYSNGTAKVPNGPGWGIELDEKALEKYATGPTITIKK